MTKMLFIINVFLFVLISCDHISPNSNISNEQQLRENDSLRNVIDSLDRKVAISTKAPDPIEEYVYARIEYTIARENLVKGAKIEGFYDVNGKYISGVDIADRYETVFVPYFYISPIRLIQWNSMYLDEDLKYKFLDEMESDLRQKTIGNSIKIVKREVKIFPTYAEASKSIENLKMKN